MEFQEGEYFIGRPVWSDPLGIDGSSHAKEDKAACEACGRVCWFSEFNLQERQKIKKAFLICSSCAKGIGLV